MTLTAPRSVPRRSCIGAGSGGAALGPRTAPGRTGAATRAWLGVGVGVASRTTIEGGSAPAAQVISTSAAAQVEALPVVASLASVASGVGYLSGRELLRLQPRAF